MSLNIRMNRLKLLQPDAAAACMQQKCAAASVDLAFQSSALQSPDRGHRQVSMNTAAAGRSVDIQSERFRQFDCDATSTGFQPAITRWLSGEDGGNRTARSRGVNLAFDLF